MAPRKKKTTPRFTKIPRSDWRSGHIFDAAPPYRIRSVKVLCPKCRRWHGLKGYKVDDNGKVSPAVLCPHCEKTTHIRLEEWIP